MDTLINGGNGAQGGSKVLSVIVPAYNVSAYIDRCVGSVLGVADPGKIEVIIVNDGSKDDTPEKARALAKRFEEGDVVIIDKENGGHGSTVNAGLEAARGKYVRIVDGDDHVNTADLERLIAILEDETADIVVTDYSEDHAGSGELVPCRYYGRMEPGVRYEFDELCRGDTAFPEWGPILATASYRLEVLKGRIRLTEHSYYTDMEFDAFSVKDAKTIVYYPLDVYRYFVGREGQSISQASYMRNYKQHENVIFNVIKFYYEGSLSEPKRNYVLKKIIIPMITAQYVILINYLKSGREYIRFEKKLAAYPGIANDPAVATKMKKFHRATRGAFVKCDRLIKKIAAKNG